MNRGICDLRHTMGLSGSYFFIPKMDMIIISI